MRGGRKKNGDIEEEEGAQPPSINFCIRHCLLI
jgi:hypothetical protein